MFLRYEFIYNLFSLTEILINIFRRLYRFSFFYLFAYSFKLIQQHILIKPFLLTLIKATICRVLNFFFRLCCELLKGRGYFELITRTCNPVKHLKVQQGQIRYGSTPESLQQSIISSTRLNLGLQMIHAQEFLIFQIQLSSNSTDNP